MISVALAAYNGERFIMQQLESILPQLDENDEVIVSDDAPGGETQRLVEACAMNDGRVRYVKGRGQGLIKNFEYALSLCRGDVIFLSDQDDVWLPGKVEKVMAAFDAGADLVLHDAAQTDEQLNIVDSSYFSVRGSKKGFLRNFIKNSYMGCCMAFNRKILESSLPFPEGIPMHDQWIGLVAEKRGRVELICEPLIYHRIHGENMTGGGTTALQKLKWRLRLFKSLVTVKR